MVLINSWEVARLIQAYIYRKYSKAYTLGIQIRACELKTLRFPKNPEERFERCGNASEILRNTIINLILTI
jgi:hypothetical protein